jgi:hypothetical protein
MVRESDQETTDRLPSRPNEAERDRTAAEQALDRLG